MRKMKWMIACALLAAGAATAEIVTIDEQYNGGSNIAEYVANDTTNPYDGTANGGNANFEVGKAVGSNASGLSRPAFYFQIPAGYTSEQITNAVLSFRLNIRNSPTTDLDIYSAYATSLGTRDAAFAKAMFSDASFTDTGLGIGYSGAGTGIYDFDVTALVKAALERGNTTNVIAFRLQMKNDTTFVYNSIDNYQIIGFGAVTDTYRPNLVLGLGPKPVKISLFAITGVICDFLHYNTTK